MKVEVAPSIDVPPRNAPSRNTPSQSGEANREQTMNQAPGQSRTGSSQDYVLVDQRPSA